MKNTTVIYLHAIGSFGECLNYENPVFLAPSMHHLIRINDGTDVVHDVLGLSTLIVEGDAKRCQGFKGCSYIDFRPTRDTYMYIWKVEVNKILNETKDLFSCGRQAGIVWTLVESIND